MPNGDKAVSSELKLLGYCLNKNHPVGAPHAILFDTLLGITAQAPDRLREALRLAASSGDATPGQRSVHGVKYEIRFEVEGPRGRYTVLSVWMTDSDQTVPRLITCYVI